MAFRPRGGMRADHRDENEAEIIETYDALGAHVQQICEPGFPDLVVCWRGVISLIEVIGEGKDRNNRRRGGLTEVQVAWHLEWKGAPVHLVRNPTEALAAIGAI